MNERCTVHSRCLSIRITQVKKIGILSTMYINVSAEASFHHRICVRDDARQLLQRVSRSREAGIPASYSGGHRFKSYSENRLLGPRVFVVFFHPFAP